MFLHLDIYFGIWNCNKKHELATSVLCLQVSASTWTDCVTGTWCQGLFNGNTCINVILANPSIQRSLRFSWSVSSVTQSCLTLCDHMDCSMPGLPVHHQLLEFTQTYVHWGHEDKIFLIDLFKKYDWCLAVTFAFTFRFNSFLKNSTLECQRLGHIV